MAAKRSYSKVILTGIGLVAVLGFLNFTRSQSPAPAASGTLAQLSPENGAQSSSPSATPQPLPKDFPVGNDESFSHLPTGFSTMSDAVKQCWPKRSDALGSLADQALDINRLEHLFGPTSTRESVEEIEHYRLADGSERRLVLSIEEGEDNKSQWQLRFFGVDAEGLPIPMPVPESHVKNPSAATLAPYREGERIRTLRRLALVFNLNQLRSAGTVTEVDGRVEEIQIRSDGRLLHCASFDRCECL
ncbi:MAG: hypothetical protein IPJ84_05495 [Bdellovibrionales bacterium]|nr:hypothetical protein [Bdellovibrionales bacterium]